MFLAVSPEEKESWVNALNVAIIKAKNRALDEVLFVFVVNLNKTDEILNTLLKRFVSTVTVTDVKQFLYSSHLETVFWFVGDGLFLK